MRRLRWIKPVITTALMLGFVAAIGVIGAHYLATKSREISAQTLPTLTHLAIGTQYRSQAFLHLVRAVNSTGQESAQHEMEIRKYSELSQEEFARYESTIQTEENYKLYQDFITERGRYVECRNEIITLCHKDQKDLAAQKLNGEFLPMYERYLCKGQKLVNYAVQEGVARADAIRRISLGSQIFTVLASIAIFIFGFFLGYIR